MKTIASKDSRWKAFPFAKFDMKKHAGHKALFDTIRNKIVKVKTEAIKAKEDARKAEEDNLKQ